MNQSGPRLGFTRVFRTSGLSAAQCPRNQSARKPLGPELWFEKVVSLHLLVIDSEVLPHTGQYTQHAFRHPPVRGEQERIVPLCVCPKLVLFFGGGELSSMQLEM
jgi:hypothetical protein